MTPVDYRAARDALARGELTAVELVEACLARIAAYDDELHAVIAVHPEARAAAAASDARRAAGTAGPLEGIPVLVKDNVAVAGLPTTAGSRALARHHPPEALLVARLRAAGAVILGKTNLSEWANFRSTRSSSGWSALGGQTRNPHRLDRNPSGSSSGSAVAAAAGYAPLTVGTETDGSIVSPAAACGVVGFKPTLGAIPGEGIVPISSAQDTAGPMTRDVAGAAALFAVLADRAPAELDAAALSGLRVGAWFPPPGSVDADALAVFDAARDAIRAAGASEVTVEVEETGLQDVEYPALLTEFHHEISAYLAGAPDAAAQNLAGIIAFNAADDVELSVFGQENFELALATPPLTDETYRAQRREATRLARAALDRALEQADVLLNLSRGPAWPTDHESGDLEGLSTSSPAAVAGYPSITVPAGFVDGLPLGVTFTAAAGRDDWLLGVAYAFEQQTQARREPDLALLLGRPGPA